MASFAPKPYRDVMQGDLPGDVYPLEPDPASAHPRRDTMIAVLKGRDAPCLNCGYNLRGLMPDGSCPECGMAIMRSLQGARLRFSDEAYLRALHLGASAIVYVSLGEVVGIVGMLVIAVILGGVDPALLAGVFLLAQMLRAAGWWAFTTPDPALTSNARGDRVRRALRVAAVTAAAASVPIFTHTTLVNWGLAAPLAWLALLAAWITQFFASLLYLRGLAARVPDQSLRDHAATSLWLLPSMFIGGIVAGILGPALGCLPVIAALVLLPVTWAMYLALLWHARADLSQALRQRALSV